MVKFVAINKLGVPEQASMKTMDTLYKRCKFRKKEGFENRKSWTLLVNKDKKIYIHIFAKNTGRHGTINKYELPPPIDNDLFYGTVAVVASTDKDNTNTVDLTVEMWNQIYDKLMGGFEDLDNDENDSEDEEEEIPEKYRTDQGYSKETNFVVDDDDVEYHSSSSSPEEEEYHFSGEDSDQDSFHSVGGKNDEDDEDEKVIKDEFVPSEGEEDDIEDADSELSVEEYEPEEN
jgi:hypothetical protein